MGTISLEHGSRLYWLGRYTERAFTTLAALQDLYDKMIDHGAGYTDYLNAFGLSDKYGSASDFFRASVKPVAMSPGMMAQTLIP